MRAETISRTRNSPREKAASPPGSKGGPGGEAAARARARPTYKRDLVAQVNSHPQGRARRIEDRWAPGVLDMIIKLPGLPLVWAEGKLIEGNLFGPTAIQYEEGMKWQEANVQCVLIGWKNGQMYVSEWCKQADYRECFTMNNQPYVEILWEFLQP